MLDLDSRYAPPPKMPSNFIEVKKRPEIKRVYEDDSWVIDLIDGKVRISYFENYHFIDDIVISKDTFKE